jgi:hypothetical protein
VIFVKRFRNKTMIIFEIKGRLRRQHLAAHVVLFRLYKEVSNRKLQILRLFIARSTSLPSSEVNVVADADDPAEGSVTV